MTENISRCGICNLPIDPDSNWHETDCVICEMCSQRAKNEMEEREREMIE